MDVYKVTLSDGNFYTFTVTNGRDGQDGADGQNGVDGKNGQDGKNGINGQNGADGLNGKNGADGKNGISSNAVVNSAPETDDRNGTDDQNGMGIADIQIDDDGNFIFTLSDGSVINAGKAETSGDQAVAASAAPSIESLSTLQLKLDSLQKQVNQQGSSNRIAYIALAVSVISFLWNVISLINDLKRRKRPVNPVG